MILKHNNKDYYLFTIWTDGTFELLFQYFITRPPYDSEQKRSEFLEKVNGVPGVKLSATKITGRPWFYLSSLNDEAALDRLLGIYEEMVEEIKTL